MEIWYAVQIKCRFLVKKSQTIKIITSLSTKIIHSKSVEFDQNLVFEPKTTDLSKSVICDLHSRNRRDWWKKDGVYNIQKCVLLLSTYKCLRHSRWPNATTIFSAANYDCNFNFHFTSAIGVERTVELVNQLKVAYYTMCILQHDRSNWTLVELANQLINSVVHYTHIARERILG